MENLTKLEQAALQIFGAFCRNEQMDMMSDEKRDKYIEKSYRMANAFLKGSPTA